MNQVSVTKQVADHIRRLRVERRWSARQLAEECARVGMDSLTRSTIAKIESGVRKSISVEELAVLSKILGVPTDVLIGSGTASMAPVESSKLVVNPVQALQSFLDEPVESTSYDIEAIQIFRQYLRSEVEERLGPDLAPRDFLARAHLSVGDQLTRAGALLFAEDPSIACPTAIVKCTLYYGIDRTASRESLEIDGTIPAQIINTHQFIADRVRVGDAEFSAQRQEIFEYAYPMIAVREVVANALVHRDYTVIDSCTHVRLFSDRLEISSPGRWYGRNLSEGTKYSLASLAGQSVKRNFRLAQALSWIRLVEGEGSGIPVALADCQAMSISVPTVIQQDGFVTITLYLGK